MQLGLPYSLRMFLEDRTGIPTILIYDGIDLPDEKPFIEIRQLPNSNTTLSKQRESVEVTYRFQIGLFADSHAERTQRQDEIRDLFLFEDIPLYTNLGELTSRFFNVNLTNEVPFEADDLSDKTNTHRVYFDVEITNVTHKNKRRN